MASSGVLAQTQAQVATTDMWVICQRRLYTGVYGLLIILVIVFILMLVALFVSSSVMTWLVVTASVIVILTIIFVLFRYRRSLV